MRNISKDEKVMINEYDAASKLLNLGDSKVASHYKTYRQKVDLFFIDFDFVPMLVQENYLNAMQAGMDKRAGGRDAKADLRDLERMAEAADLISTGDTANILIRQH